MAADRTSESTAAEDRRRLNRACLANALRLLTVCCAVWAAIVATHAAGGVDTLRQAWLEMVGRRMIVYSARGDQMVKTSPTWVDANGDTNQVVTEAGVVPPLVLVEADEDPAGESPEEFDQRHRDRIAEAKRRWPPV